MNGVVAVDGVRVAALVSVVVALVGYGGVAAAVLFLVLGGTMVPRVAGAPAALDGAYCLTILVAAWAAVLDWYLAVPWLDVVVHAAATGLIAAVVQWVLVRAGMASTPDDAQPRHPRAAVAVLTAAMGTALAVVWELCEWFGHTYLDDRIQVGYTDTLGDVTAGMVGAAVAGALLGGGVLLRGARA
ncbi:hypothetical protein [Nocardioides sp. SYSU DS0663]|uniref:hypothetical protein n=1 Tax=Nocardioides sp. SYSU DS0663 TaxID=3416445 RepID=UPI003F4B2234